MATMSTTLMNEGQARTFWQKNRVLITFLSAVAVIIIYNFIRDQRITTAVLSSALRQSTPLVLGAFCGLMCERSGIVNIGIEGTMLLSAFVGFMASAYTGNIWLSVFIGVGAGASMGVLLAYMSVTLKMDQIIGGTVINILAIGLTGYFYQQGITAGSKLRAISIPALSDIPLIGPVFFRNPPITYLTLILIVVLHLVLYYSRWGLRTRAVGEHPRAADTVGISVTWVRYINVIVGSCLAGLAGVYLSLEAVGAFERGMTNGRGFVALAVMLFGKRTPFGAWGAALLFGFASALQTQLQFGGAIDIPHQFIGMLPYLLTILVLAGFVGRTRDPKALGQPYTKE